MGDKADDSGANSELRGLSSYLDVSILFPPLFSSLGWGRLGRPLPAGFGVASVRPLSWSGGAALGAFAPLAFLLGVPLWGSPGGGAFSPPRGCLPWRPGAWGQHRYDYRSKRFELERQA